MITYGNRGMVWDITKCGAGLFTRGVLWTAAPLVSIYFNNSDWFFYSNDHLNFKSKGRKLLRKYEKK